MSSPIDKITVQYSSGAIREYDGDKFKLSSLTLDSISEMFNMSVSKHEEGKNIRQIGMSEKGDFRVIDYTLIGSRVAKILYDNNSKYEDKDNWKKGIPTSRSIDGIVRHIVAYFLEQDFEYSSEDNLAAIIFGVMCIMQTEYLVSVGRLPSSYIDHIKVNNES